MKNISFHLKIIFFNFQVSWFGPVNFRWRRTRLQGDDGAGHSTCGYML